MKTKLLAIALGLAACVAQAAPSFSFANVPAGWDGAYSIKLTGFENFSNGLNVGSQNYGVLKVTSIQTIGFGEVTIWADGQNGAEITGVFSEIEVSNFIAAGPGGFLYAIGGTTDLYINPMGSLVAAGGFTQGIGGYAAAGGGCTVNQNCYHGVSDVVGGGLLLSADYVPGADTFDDPLVNTVVGTLTAANPLRGSAQGYLAVTGGAAADIFDTNGFIGGTADLNANNTFCTVGTSACATFAQAGGTPASGGWQLKIDDPVVGSVKLPEPASLALVGLGLLGAGMARRRKSA
jgi:hypothetical protein